jgi:hypothetical protein
MPKKFKLKFSKDELSYWASRYSYNNEDFICNVLAPKIQQQNYLTKDDLILLSKWKSPRPYKHVLKNDEDFVKEVTSISLTTSNTKLSIEILTLLNGVNWPVASVILHFGKNNKYPILDYRALWSLNVNNVAYNYDLWNEYSNFCRNLATKCKVSMRILDRALWQYSKENQS